MNVIPTMSKNAAAMEQPRARMGLIIPSVNTYSEPQFNHFAPEGLGIHVARARVAGEWKRPLPEMKGEIADAAKLLSDARPDVIVFHCTDTSMTQGRRAREKFSTSSRMPPASTPWRRAGWCLTPCRRSA